MLLGPPPLDSTALSWRQHPSREVAEAGPWRTPAGAREGDWGDLAGGMAIATEPSQQFALGLLARSVEALKAYEYDPFRTIGASGDPCTNRPTIAGKRRAMGNHGCERDGLPCRRSAKGRSIDSAMTATERPTGFLVSGERVTGLVNLSDLHRLPVRARRSSP